MDIIIQFPQHNIVMIVNKNLYQPRSSHLNKVMDPETHNNNLMKEKESIRKEITTKMDIIYEDAGS